MNHKIKELVFMEPATTIRGMMALNHIFVPAYQRAYSWDTPKTERTRKTQVDVFLRDIIDYCDSQALSPYYFGHFLFEKKDNNQFGIIDGQQRLTTIVIFLAAIFSTIKKSRSLTDEEENYQEDMIKRRSEYRFSTVAYDNQLFLDYVIKQTRKDKNGIETESAQRIVDAFDFFIDELAAYNLEQISRFLVAVSTATCTTHSVLKEPEAIQMFIFQNNRGKKPSNLEIVKAQFMYSIHLYGKEDTDNLINEIKNRFEKIYKSISKIEYRIDEDDVLVYTQRVYFNSLTEGNAIDKINKQLLKPECITFIIDFTMALSLSFENLSLFLTRDQFAENNIHSLTVLGGIAISIPFILKAYKFGLPIDKIGMLSKALESIVLRHRIVGTRAELETRLNGVYKNFTEENTSIETLIETIEYIKSTSDGWWSYWNNEQLVSSLQGWLPHDVARYILWKYENHLRQKGKSGYQPLRFDAIESPELEHIAPTTEPKGKNHGYDKYDDEFVSQYIDCLGNYLLLSKSHNASIHNDPFQIKIKDYNYLEQQREIVTFTEAAKPVWTKKEINERHAKLVQFVTDNL